MFALIPLIFFLCVYLGVSIWAGDFYKVPITVAFMLTAIVSVIVSRGTLKHRLRVFSRGSSSENMMLMIWIFILAGAFANTAKEMGSINDIVSLTLSLVPSDTIFAGLFLAAAVISLSIGTSVGTIVALMPIAVGIASTIGQPVPYLAAIVVGGAFFGDNLSFISDTTVCATQTQGCRMSDKFKTNLRIAAPAAMILLIYYAFVGSEVQVPAHIAGYKFMKVIPYIIVLLAAMLGVNVLVVLALGTLLTGIVGLCYGDYNLYTWFAAMADGIMGMGELIIITMLAGGMLEVIRANGGIRFLMEKIMRHVSSPRTAELSIAALVSVVDVCTANNTVAIITVSGIAKDISNRFGLDPRRVASILDTFSCIVQGVIPYGAQLLMGAALASINPVDIIPHLYYPLVLLVFALGFIIFHKQKKPVADGEYVNK
ncbi:MAG: Na+/H+ antiporter NhaC family protein [Prevotella sp.]|nr:Na+/H+ antiporter NhaC family protein [Prevotella sp.]